MSLKHSTIEACFSVPMLNLTLPNFPFIVAFAVKGMGWHAGAIGLMAALPHICNFLQPALLAGLSRHFSNYGLLRLTFLLGGVPWMTASLLFLYAPARHWAFVSALLLATVANSVASVAWSSAISEVVPERLAARYFARRTLIYSVWTLLAVLAAGHFAEWNQNAMAAFSPIFFCAGASRLVGVFFLSRMRFPAVVMERRSNAIALADLLGVFRNGNYVLLCLFIGLWGLLLNSAMPFYTVFLVDKLQLGVGAVVKLTTLSSLGGLLTLKGWGRLCERYGNRPVLQVAAVIWASTSLAMWSLARPGWLWHLSGGYLVVGAMTAGFQLVQFNLMIRLAPARVRPAYVAVFMAFTSLLTAAGPVVGARLLHALPNELGSLAGQSFGHYHLLFAISAVGCALATFVLWRVNEPAGQTARSVWREMKSMRTFNPMLSILGVAQLLLTPRALLAFGDRGLRTVRQQVKALEEVGGEIVEGSREAIPPKFLRSSSSPDSSGSAGGRTPGRS